MEDVHSVEPILMSDSFWEGAFNPHDPFREELLREFRRGVIYGGPSDLAWGRMAIYGLSDNALWPVVNRLVQLATVDPSADFVESLAFFLSSPETLERMRAALNTVSPDGRRIALRRTQELGAKLAERGDTDLGQRLESFVTLLLAL